MSYDRIFAGILSYALLACAICGCAKSDSSTDTNATGDSDSVEQLDASQMFTDRDKDVGYDSETAVSITLSDQANSCDSPAVSIKDNTITISDEGTYLLSGSLKDGQIVVDADQKKVHLVLDSAKIENSTSAAIYVKAADKVFITSADQTENTLSNTDAFPSDGDTGIDGVIFSKDDLTLNGTGTLSIVSCSHGIVSKDDLVITGGNYDITAQKHALSGKDSVRIADGVFTLNAGTDGIHSENADDDEKGFIYLGGGDMNITSKSDGIDAEETLQVDGGTVAVSAGDDGLHADGDLIITDGTITITKSYEGLEGMTVTMDGGNVTVVAEDDGINAAGDGSSGETSAKESTDRKADDPVTGENNQNPPQRPNDTGSGKNDQKPPLKPNNTDTGNNGQTPPQIPDNTESDKTMPDAGKNDPRGKKGNMRGGGMEEATDYNKIRIHGGTLTIDANGDGIDSNGSLDITGGTIYVNGPTNHGNGALDYAGTAAISGGTVIAVGAAGMAQNFGTDSTQGCIMVTVSDSMTEGDITLTDTDGNTLVSYSPTKTYNSVIISCANLTQGATYTLTTGDITTDVTMNSLTM